MNFTFKNILPPTFLCSKLSCFVKPAIFFALLFFTNTLYAQFTKLVVNEFSQGSNGTKEYIEIVVVGTRTCTDSTLDLRGWIIDDNNGWYGTDGISAGHIRFAIDANWQKVPYGSIILIYNQADKNSSITQSDDPTDNLPKDNVYILPINSIYLDNNNNNPAGGTAVTTYAGSTYTSQGNETSVGLRNGGDAIIIVNPATPTTAHFSIAFGSNLTGSPNIYKSSVIAGKNCYLIDANYGLSSSWTVGTAPSNETPGSGNTTSNIAWINSLRKSAYPAPPTITHN